MIIGIDIGTTAIAGVLVDPATRRVLRTERFANPGDRAGTPPGHHEQDPETIEAACFEVARRLIAAAPEPVSGLAFSGQMHGVVAVDAALRPLTPLITWQDQRAAALPRELLAHPYVDRTGCALHPGYGAATVAAMRCDGSFPAETATLLPIPGFLIARLTGRRVTDPTFAASWGIWDLPAGRWCEPLIAALDLPESLLPEVVPSGHPVGRVTRGPAFLTGIELYSPVGDNQAGVFAAQTLYPESVALNLGTSAQLSRVVADYRYDPAMETRPMPGGGFMLAYATLCGGWGYAYLAKFFQQVVRDFAGIETPLDAVFGKMEELAGAGDPEGLHADTRFAGSRQEAGCDGGALTGISETNLRPGPLIAAFADGIVDELARGFPLGPATAVVGLGNALRLNGTLRRAVERRLGVPCRIPEVEEMTAYGAAVCRNDE